jgi:predicted transposase YdaD
MSDTHYHDTGYKLLFSHAELVQQLLEGFAPAELVKLLDFTTLTLVNGSYVTPNTDQREDDIVWSVSMGDTTLYLYILLEFQSTVDAAMPVRMMQTEQLLEDSSMLATNMQKWYHTAQTQGKQEGEHSRAMQIALNLLDLLDDATIALKTGLTLDEVKALKKDQGKV